jgi:hypothetical protein
MAYNNNPREGRYSREGRTSDYTGRYNDMNESRGRFGREEDYNDYDRDEDFENEFESEYEPGYEEEDYEDEYNTGNAGRYEDERLERGRVGRSSGQWGGSNIGSYGSSRQGSQYGGRQGRGTRMENENNYGRSNEFGRGISGTSGRRGYTSMNEEDRGDIYGQGGQFSNRNRQTTSRRSGRTSERQGRNR